MAKSKVDLNRTARIMIVDDHPMLRDGLVRLIGQQSDMICCGEAGSVAFTGPATPQDIDTNRGADGRVRVSDRN